MLFEQPFWAGIAVASITMTFRRWKRRQVVAGNRYRTPAGVVEVEAIDVVDAPTIWPTPTSPRSPAASNGSTGAGTCSSPSGSAPACARPTSRPPFDREVPAFKRDVRKLKNLGLTISLEVGYRLSPRGEAYLRRTPTIGA